MGSGGQRSVKTRAAGGGATTVAAAATSAGSTGGGSGTLNSTPQSTGRTLFGTETFSTMTRSQQEQIVNDSLSAPQKKNPSAYDSGYQKFINNSGLDGKPQLMDSDEFDKASGPVIYRTINTDPWGMKAKDIVESTANDDIFLYNAGGGMAHGVGLYTTPSYDGSRVYGDNYNSTKTSMMRFKIKDDAKIGSAPDIKAQYLKESKKRGTLAYKLANDQRITSRASGRSHMDDSRIGIYAASKGYSVLVESSGLTTQKQFRQLLSSGSDVYTVVLNRGALIMDKNAKQVKQNGSGVKWQNFKTNSKVK